MNIGFDAKRLFHNQSGLGQYSRYVLTHLCRLYPEHQYRLFASRDSELYSPKGMEQLVRLPSPSFYYRSVDMRKLWKIQKLDLYHGLSNELPVWKSSSVKTVVTIHDLLYEDFPMDYPWLDRQVYRYKTKKALEQSDAVVAISKKTKQELVDRYGAEPDKIEVIYQSCRTDFFEPISEEEMTEWREAQGLHRPYILCVGSFSYRKSQSTLIDAFYHSGIYNRYDLVLVGADSGYKRKMKKRVEDLGLTEPVRWPEGLSDWDVRRAYSGCAMVVYPSLKEGFGIPVLEGMASRKPVIVRNGTSCHEAGDDAVMTFSDGPAELAECLLAIDGNEELRNKMIVKGSERVKVFSPDIEIPKLMALYEKVLNSVKATPGVISPK